MEETGIQSNRTLTRQQKILLTAFSPSALADEFHLSEGMALAAFHLHHRISDDLDFFASSEVRT